MLSHYWSNKTVLKVIETGAKSNTINHMIVVDAIVRNDEVVGSIPTSSTKFPSELPFLKSRSVTFQDSW